MQRLPSSFTSLFDSKVLHAEQSTLVALDPSGNILWTNDAWHEFARANGGGDCTERFGLGACYFDGIKGELRAYYETAFGDALRTGKVFEQDYECSSPELERQHHLRALPIIGDGLLVEHSVVRVVPHDREAAQGVESHYLDASGLILQCSNCRRVRRTESRHWDWIPTWVSASPPHTSHGLCDVCFGFYCVPLLKSRRPTVP
jgi:hypothetical protein